MTIRIFTIVPFTLACVTLASTLGASSAHAYACKNTPVQAVGIKLLKGAASAASKANWTTSVKNQYGLSWSVWSIATSKSGDCVKLGNKWRCLASAKPCNYVVP